MAVQAPQLYSSENLGLPTTMTTMSTGLQQDWSMQLNPVSGLDDIFSSFPSPQPLHDHFHLRQAPQSQNTIDIDCCNQLGVSVAPSTFNCFLPTPFSEALGAQLDLQRHELDCILQLQNEKLRFALQEQRKQQLAALLRNLESRTLSLIRQKEEHLAQATKRAIELQDCLRKAEMESETWQRMAKANETMVIDLNNTLEQVRERLVFVSNEAEDAESCCGSCDRGGHRDNDRVAMLQEHRVVEEKGKKLACKNCNTRRSCVLFLPCRHLCSCKSCEPFLGSCPVCESTKEASMEVFLV
ncbi:hypothetical protein PRUPE_1G362300 [Prunus persica]|uniref:RING-type domain-containing protein n=1 Tax=Prunus persica TaxID=3760 RepID=M5XUJ5_PRUPE|nr:probable BOI-related E3 ubiquitin-protein ligase 2 [Prunus persica]ONI32343.1 hypothetical protein PRUPE_1G362300 [Prunus persica]